jgi:hypothetical protein
MFAATTRKPGEELPLFAQFRGERGAVVRSITNKILVPADAEIILEGYLDEKGYIEPEGPFGEYMGYYGAIHMDPVFHCTAITMRKDAMHQTFLHGSAFSLDHSDGAVMSAMRVGVRFVRFTPVMRAAMIRSAAFYGPASAPWALLPLIVHDELHLGAGTFGDDQEAKYTNTGIYADHAYSILGYEKSGNDRLVIMRNPWGESEPAGNGPNDGIFKLKLADFQKLYQTMYFGQ